MPRPLHTLLLAAALSGSLALPVLAQPRAEVVARGLAHPWALAFLPDGRLLVTERAGRLRLIGADGRVLQTVAGLPPVDAGGQCGLLDLAVDPRFAENGRLYWTYAEASEGGNGVAVARGRLEGGRLEDVRVIFQRQIITFTGP